MLEKISDNRVYKRLNENNLLYKKSAFQKVLSFERAIMQLVDQINCNFEKDLFKLGIFIDLIQSIRHC